MYIECYELKFLNDVNFAIYDSYAYIQCYVNSDPLKLNNGYRFSSQFVVLYVMNAQAILYCRSQNYVSSIVYKNMSEDMMCSFLKRIKLCFYTAYKIETEVMSWGNAF